MIDSFRGEHAFLSNFFYAPVAFDGDEYPTVEHAYQAAKTLDLTWQYDIRSAPTPGEAKRRGRLAPLDPTWEQRKLRVMGALVRRKFERPHLRGWLLATGDSELVEGNAWGDTFWGVCGGAGENHLGKILMRVRDELRGECG